MFSVPCPTFIGTCSSNPLILTTLSSCSLLSELPLERKQLKDLPLEYHQCRGFLTNNLYRSLVKQAPLF